MTTFTFSGPTSQVPYLPLTINRTLDKLAVANLPLCQHQLVALAAAGAVAGTAAQHDLIVADTAWLDIAELRLFITDLSVGVLRTQAGTCLVSKVAGPEKAQTTVLSFSIDFAWDLLMANERALATKTDFTRAAEYHSSLYVDGRLQVGQGTKILPGVVIEGDVVIGEDCKIGPHCYIRGATSIGHRCHVGQAVELKNSILMDGTNVGHLAYVGDSILGEKVNFGAGTITSNLRHDGHVHRSMVGGQLVDTGRRKLGAIIGDRVHTGINTTIYPGRKIWPELTTRPGAIVACDLFS